MPDDDIRELFLTFEETLNLELTKFLNTNKCSMEIFLCLIKTIVAYLVFMIVGTNLLGMVMRGLIQSYRKNDVGDLTLIEDITSSKSIITTVFFLLVSSLYFIALYHYWNIGIVTAAAIVMLARLPDLLLEMKTGEKLTSKNMTKRPIDVFLTILSWAALPLIWYSVCYF